MGECGLEYQLEGDRARHCQHAAELWAFWMCSQCGALFTDAAEGQYATVTQTSSATCAHYGSQQWQIRHTMFVWPIYPEFRPLNNKEATNA